MQRHPADLQHVGHVGQGQCHRRVLLDQNHGRAPPVDLGDHLADACDHPRRQPERRLVQEQHPGRGHQRPGDRQHLLLAAGEQPGALARALAQQRKQLEHPLPRRSARPRRRREAAGAQVLLDREVGEDLAALRHLDHAGPDHGRRIHPVQPAAAELHRTGVDPSPVETKRPRDRAQQRALPGPVGSEYRDDSVARYVDGHAMQCPQRPRVGDMQVAHAQQRRMVRGRWPLGRRSPGRRGL